MGQAAPPYLGHRHRAGGGFGNGPRHLGRGATGAVEVLAVDAVVDAVVVTAAVTSAVIVAWTRALHQSGKMSHIDIQDDHIDTIISHIISP